MKFGAALLEMEEGLFATREGWNGKGIYIGVRTPTENSDMPCRFVYINTMGLQTDNPHARKVIVPWFPSQTDMLANDWMILGQEVK